MSCCRSTNGIECYCEPGDCLVCLTNDLDNCYCALCPTVRSAGAGYLYNPFGCTQNFTRSQVNSMQFSQNSLDVTFFTIDGEVIETFKDIPGKLDTELCANGSYDDQAVKGLFLRLINYRFDTSVIGSIPFKLAAFFASIALEQRIVDSIIVLTEKLLTGEITLEQFNVLVKVREQEAAALFGKDYETNFVGGVQAINKFKYILLSAYTFNTPCKCNDPVKSCDCNDH